MIRCSYDKVIRCNADDYGPMGSFLFIRTCRRGAVSNRDIVGILLGHWYICGQLALIHRDFYKMPVGIVGWVRVWWNRRICGMYTCVFYAYCSAVNAELM